MSYCDISSRKQLEKEIMNGHVIGCSFCNTEFDEKDKKKAIETFRCSHCGEKMWRGLTL